MVVKVRAEEVSASFSYRLKAANFGHFRSTSCSRFENASKVEIFKSTFQKKIAKQQWPICGWSRRPLESEINFCDEFIEFRRIWADAKYYFLSQSSSWLLLLLAWRNFEKVNLLFIYLFQFTSCCSRTVGPNCFAKIFAQNGKNFPKRRYLYAPKSLGFLIKNEFTTIFHCRLIHKNNSSLK